MSFDISTGRALVCSNESRDVLKLNLEIDEDGIIEKADFTYTGSPKLYDIIKKADILQGMPIEDAAEYEPEDFVNKMSDIHLGIMLINVIRLAIMNYATRKRMGDDDENESYREGFFNYK